jgi:hypothetical protein
LREGWQRKSFVFFNLNLFQVLKTKIAANSPTQSGEEERRSQLQGHAQMPLRTAEIHKKSATLDLHHKERI